MLDLRRQLSKARVARPGRLGRDCLEVRRQPNALHAGRLASARRQDQSAAELVVVVAERLVRFGGLQAMSRPSAPSGHVGRHHTEPVGAAEYVRRKG